MSDELPEGWASTRVGDLFASHGGGTPNRATAIYWKGNIPWLSSGDIKATSISQSSETITKRGLEESAARLCRKGSVLVVVRSGILKHTLPVAVLEREAAINQDIKAFDSGDDQLNAWLALAWRASARKLLTENREGTTVQSVKLETLNDFVLPLAPPAEQRRIVAKLEALLGKVDASQQRLAKIPVLLKRFRQSVFAAACSGRLTADWREENSNVQPASKILAAAKPADDLPSGWAWCALGDYVENLDGKRVPISSKLRETRKGAFPYYGASGVIDSIDGFTHEGEFLLIGEDGANLLSRSTPIAFLAKGQIWVNNHVHVLRCKHSFPNAYLAAYINSIDLAPYVSGTAQPKLNQTNMNTIPVPAPPLPEQQEIVRRVEGLFALADQLEVRLAKARGQVDALTPSLLARAFSGNLVPQDPTDEPAAASLKRIKTI